MSDYYARITFKTFSGRDMGTGNIVKLCKCVSPYGDDALTISKILKADRSVEIGLVKIINIHAFNDIAIAIFDDDSKYFLYMEMLHINMNKEEKFSMTKRIFPIADTFNKFFDIRDIKWEIFEGNSDEEVLLIEEVRGYKDE